MQEDEGKNRCKDRFQGEQESCILRCCILLHNSLYDESVGRGQESKSKNGYPVQRGARKYRGSEHQQTDYGIKTGKALLVDSECKWIYLSGKIAV